jgi:hypothetical protein
MKRTSNTILRRAWLPLGLVAGVFVGGVAGLAPQEASAWWLCWTNCGGDTACTNRACTNDWTCGVGYKKGKKCAYVDIKPWPYEKCVTRDCS